MHQLNGTVGNQAGLLGRFGNHGVAHCQCGHDFAGENGQREIPGADGHQRAQGLAFGAGGFAFIGVIAAEIHGFAHFGNGVVQRFTGFAHGQHHQFGCVLFVQIGNVAQDFGTLCRLLLRPFGFCLFGIGHDFIDFGRLHERRVAHHVVVIGRIADFMRGFVFNAADHQGFGLVIFFRRFVHGSLQIVQHGFIR